MCVVGGGGGEGRRVWTSGLNYWHVQDQLDGKIDFFFYKFPCLLPQFTGLITFKQVKAKAKTVGVIFNVTSQQL